MAKLESLILSTKETKDVESWDIIFHPVQETLPNSLKKRPNLKLELKGEMNL